MPLHSHRPVHVNDMYSGEYKKNAQYTICETLRQIWKHLDDMDLDEKNKNIIAIRLKLREATAMAQAMDSRLQKYNKQYAKTFFGGIE